MNIYTKKVETFQSLIDTFKSPKKESHKGQNGKLLVIGGSKLFHASPIWAAEIASHIVDMVHFSSTEENNEVFLSLKKRFQSGMIVHKKDIPSYVQEDDVILIGPGMVRQKIANFQFKILNFQEISKIENEAEYARELTHYLLQRYPEKQFVIDAGALQMMDKEWLRIVKMPIIITPHRLEFETLFRVSVAGLSNNEVEKLVLEKARDFNCVVLLKNIDDIVSNGKEVVRIVGGNQGLTKGGTGDLLAGLAASLATKNGAYESCSLASILLKTAADTLFLEKAFWYSVNDIITEIPEVFANLIYNKRS